jgi:hypothetical protein
LRSLLPSTHARTPRNCSASNSSAGGSGGREPEREPPGEWDITLNLGLFSLQAASPKRRSATPQVSAAAAGDDSGTAAAAQLRCALERDAPAAFAQLAATGEPIDDAFMRRWLTARGSVEAAAAAVAAHAGWRHGFVGAGGVAPARIAGELAARKVHLQGPDPRGCPVVVFQAARHVAVRDVDAAMLLMCFALDAAIASAAPAANPGGKVCCVFDLTGLAARNLDLAFLLRLFDLLQAHYPERLQRLFFVNAPLTFWGVWRCASPFVAPATRAKIAFVSGAAGRRLLLEEVGGEALPEELGGAAPLRPVGAEFALAGGNVRSSLSHAPVRPLPVGTTPLAGAGRRGGEEEEERVGPLRRSWRGLLPPRWARASGGGTGYALLERVARTRVLVGWLLAGLLLCVFCPMLRGLAARGAAPPPLQLHKEGG